jgi:uncharacterized protein (TIGR03790 family)
MKARLIIFLLVSLPVMALYSQRVSYDDVAVIINEDNVTSVEIGDYFATNRNIPEGNLIYIHCPSVEVIDSAGFQDIRQQIEAAFETQGLAGKISYLVTTKGLPFNVRKSDNCGGLDGVKYCSSFDSELSLIFSQWSGQIMDDGFVSNPYYDKWEYFDQEKFGIFLVTRLDGYTIDDVITLINRSGPGVEVVKGLSKSIIDFSYVTDESVKEMLTEFVQPAINYLQLNDWQVIFDPDDDLLTDQENVLGYYNVNYQPSNKILNFSWLPGSTSEILLSTGNLTFYKEQNVFNELSVPDLLEEGATSASTYVNSSFLSQIIQIDMLYNRYLDIGMRPPFNLAESYYMAMPGLSTQYILIGDPKTSLAIQQNNVAENAHTGRLLLYPNPAGEVVNVSFFSEVPGSYQMELLDMTGKRISSREISCGKGLTLETISLSTMPNGLYLMSVKGPDQSVRTLKFTKNLP